MNSIKTNFEQIIRWLHSIRYLSPAQVDQLLTAEQLDQKPQSQNSVDRAWYVKLFIGLSAWIAALFLIIGVSGLAFVSTGPIMAVVGVIILAAALTLKWQRQQSIFWGQFAFALSLTGQILLFGGIIQIITNDFGNFEESIISIIAVIILLVELLLFFVYPDSVHRLLSVIFASLAGIVLLVNELILRYQLTEQIGAVPPLLLILFSLGLLWIWQSRTKFFASRWHELHVPLGYGLAIVVFGLSLSTLFIDDIAQINVRFLWLASIGLALLLAHLGMQIVDEFADQFAQPFLAKLSIIVALALLLIPLYETPGLWAALLALALSFRHNSRLLLGLAGLFLLYFIGFYYYSLNITLLNKSYALIGSGLLLLLIRFVGGRLLGNHELILENKGELSA